MGEMIFKIRNFEIKIPNDLKEEPEIQSMLDVMGIWNNSLMVRMLEMEVNLINQFTGDAKFKFHTPFIKISIDAAKKISGVYDIITAKELTENKVSDRLPLAFPSGLLHSSAMPKILAEKEVLYVGEPIAIVLAAEDLEFHKIFQDIS